MGSFSLGGRERESKRERQRERVKRKVKDSMLRTSSEYYEDGN